MKIKGITKRYWSQVFLFVFVFTVISWRFGQDDVSKIDEKDLKLFITTLSSPQFEGRAVNNDGQLKTQEFIIDRFKKLEIEPFSSQGYLDKFTFNMDNRRALNNDSIEKTIETANVLGVIRGESEKVIIISAHYDHVGTRGDIYFPGADDNASGVAALLELAEEFVQYKHLKYSMIFIAFAAEEWGLLGSKYHTDKSDFEPEKVVCCINLDMISRCDNKHTGDCNYLYCIGTENNADLDSLVRKANSLFTSCTFDYSGNDLGIFSRTDTYSFFQKGVPSILFFSGFHEDYHKPTDTIDKINFELLTNRVKLIGEVVKLLQNK